jgi:hypothetical protein
MPKQGYTRDLDDFVSYNGWLTIDGLPKTHPNRHKFRYKLDWGHYHRRPQTQNERRQNFAAQADGMPVRRCRVKGLPHSWDDLHRARDWGKSWKDYTKHRKQWERW